MAELSDNDLVIIQHPDQRSDAESRGLTPADAQTSRKAFADIWEPKGFVIIRDDVQGEIDAESDSKPAKARTRNTNGEGATS